LCFGATVCYAPFLGTGPLSLISGLSKKEAEALTVKIIRHVSAQFPAWLWKQVSLREAKDRTLTTASGAYRRLNKLSPLRCAIRRKFATVFLLSGENSPA
jgi:hypothetical protein